AALLVRSARSLVVFSRLRRGSRTQGVKQNGLRGEGWGYPKPSRKDQRTGRVFSAPSLYLVPCALALPRQSRLSQRHLMSCLEVIDPLDLPSEPQPEL